MQTYCDFKAHSDLVWISLNQTVTRNLNWGGAVAGRQEMSFGHKELCMGEKNVFEFFCNSETEFIEFFKWKEVNIWLSFFIL